MLEATLANILAFVHIILMSRLVRDINDGELHRGIVWQLILGLQNSRKTHVVWLFTLELHFHNIKITIKHFIWKHIKSMNQVGLSTCNLFQKLSGDWWRNTAWRHLEQVRPFGYGLRCNVSIEVLMSEIEIVSPATAIETMS